MSLRILIVEDEQIVAEDLKAKLSRIGHEVVGVAASGEGAIRIAELLRPELVLMDIRLQGAMNGTEAGRRIQRLTGAPIIFITAYAEIFLRDPTLMRPPGVCLQTVFRDSAPGGSRRYCEPTQRVRDAGAWHKTSKKQLQYLNGRTIVTPPIRKPTEVQHVF